eukprot:UN28245
MMYKKYPRFVLGNFRYYFIYFLNLLFNCASQFSILMQKNPFFLHHKNHFHQLCKHPEELFLFFIQSQCIILKCCPRSFWYMIKPHNSTFWWVIQYFCFVFINLCILRFICWYFYVNEYFSNIVVLYRYFTTLPFLIQYCIIITVDRSLCDIKILYFFDPLSLCYIDFYFCSSSGGNSKIILECVLLCV